MSQAQEALDKKIAAGTVAASQTNYPISTAIKMSENGALNYRVDVIVGKVVAATGVSVKLQDSSGLNLWNDLNSTAITASTTKNIVAADPVTNQINIVAHGYVAGQPLIFAQNAANSLPSGLIDSVVYYALPVDANNFQVTVGPFSNQPLDLLSAGTGTNQVSAARLFTVKVSSVDAGSAAMIPMRSAMRAVATTGAGDSLQISNVFSIQ